jgi:hypothetical protein
MLPLAKGGVVNAKLQVYGTGECGDLCFIGCARVLSGVFV